MLEAGAIVASILLAFALDAMWGERQIRQWEVSQFAALSTDMTENLVSLDAIVKAHGDTARSSEALLSLLGEVSAGDSVIIPNALLDNGMASFADVLNEEDAEAVRAFIVRQANQ